LRGFVAGFLKGKFAGEAFGFAAFGTIGHVHSPVFDFLLKKARTGVH
jgi:hypothetical protein